MDLFGTEAFEVGHQLQTVDLGPWLAYLLVVEHRHTLLSLELIARIARALAIKTIPNFVAGHGQRFASAATCAGNVCG